MYMWLLSRTWRESRSVPARLLLVCDFAKALPRPMLPLVESTLDLVEKPLPRDVL